MSITYYSITKKFFRVFSAHRARLAKLFCADEEMHLHAGPLPRNRRNVSTEFARGAQVRSGEEGTQVEKGGPTLVAEQRSEDPLIVTLDAVVTKD